MVLIVGTSLMIIGFDGKSEFLGLLFLLSYFGWCNDTVICFLEFLCHWVMWCKVPAIERICAISSNALEFLWFYRYKFPYSEGLMMNMLLPETLISIFSCYLSVIFSWYLFRALFWTYYLSVIFSWYLINQLMFRTLDKPSFLDGMFRTLKFHYVNPLYIFLCKT